jgi:hypothetical protein
MNIMNKEGTAIKSDPNLTQPNPEMAQLQEEARTTVIDGSDRINQWEPMPITSDPNANKKAKPDKNTNPGQGYKKTVTRPATPSNKSLKINT